MAMLAELSFEFYLCHSENSLTHSENFTDQLNWFEPVCEVVVAVCRSPKIIFFRQNWKYVWFLPMLALNTDIKISK